MAVGAIVQVAVVRNQSTGRCRVLAESHGLRYSMAPEWLEAPMTVAPTREATGAHSTHHLSPAVHVSECGVGGDAGAALDLWAQAEAHGVPPAVAAAAQKFLTGRRDVVARGRGMSGELRRSVDGQWRLACLNGMLLCYHKMLVMQRLRNDSA